MNAERGPLSQDESEPVTEVLQPESANDSLTPSTEIIDLKELRSMLEEIKEDEQATVRAIEEALLTPIPDPNDPVATAEYNRKMEIIRDIAIIQQGRSEMLMRLGALLKAEGI